MVYMGMKSSLNIKYIFVVFYKQFEIEIYDHFADDFPKFIFL